MCEHRLDLLVWRYFLNHPQVYCRPFIDNAELTADDVDLFSDASGSYEKGGFRAYYERRWTYRKWNEQFMHKNQLSIEYLELFGVAVAVKLWLHKLQNR